jgi:hypothetical protein
MGQQQLLLIILGVIIVGIAIAVGLSLFSAQSIQANKDAMINDLNNIAANAYQFRIRPTSMGGGGGVYDASKGATAAYTIPTKMSSNDNATYTTPTVGADAITILGTNANAAGQTVQADLDKDGKLGNWVYGDDFK